MKRRKRRNPPPRANVAAAPQPAQAAVAAANHAPAIRGEERDSLTVEKYWGDTNEDLDGWLFHVQTVSELKGWDEQRRVQRAVVALSGRARTEYQSFKMSRPNSPITWAQFEEFIRREFGPSDPIDYYTRKLNTIRQGSQETVSEYNSKFRELLAKLENVQEDRYPPRALVLYYVDGLRTEFQEDAERGTPKTLAAAYEKAELAERVWKRKMRPRSSAGVYAVTSEKPTEDTGEPPAKKPAREDDPLVKELKDLVGRNAEMIASNQKTIQLLLEQQKNQTQVTGKPMAQTGFGRGKTNFGGSCYYCKKPGHRMSECFKRKADRSRNSGAMSGQPQEFTGAKPQDGPLTERTVNVVRGPCDAAERESGLPFCELTIEGIEAVTCIFDTGSVASIISDLFAGRTGKLSSMAPGKQRYLTAADGGALAVLGSLSLKLALGDFEFQYTFEVVKDFQPTVLLGDDFLHRFKVALDYEHGIAVLTLAPGMREPFYLVHGRDSVMPTDVLPGVRSQSMADARRYGLLLTEKINEAYRIAKEHQDMADQRRKEKYDRTHYPVAFEIGSLVLLHSKVRRQDLSLKLTYHYQGPFRVLDKVSPVNYRIRHVEKNTETIVHVQRLIPFHERDEQEGVEEAEPDDEDDEDGEELVLGEPVGVPS